MDELSKAIGGHGIQQRLALSEAAFTWLNTEESPEEIQKLETVHQISITLFKQQNVEINTERYEPDDCLMSQFGSVNVQGKEIIVSDPKLFLDALRLCHDFNIEAHLDGTLKLSFSLNGLTHRILEEPDEY